MCMESNGGQNQIEIKPNVAFLTFQLLVNFTEHNLYLPSIV